MLSSRGCNSVRAAKETMQAQTAFLATKILAISLVQLKILVSVIQYIHL